MHAAFPTTRRTLLAALAAAGLTGPVHAQSADAWPRRTVKILVGFPGGSTPDLAARVLAEVLALSLIHI